jgi:hypothetical protein
VPLTFASCIDNVECVVRNWRVTAARALLFVFDCGFAFSVMSSKEEPNGRLAFDSFAAARRGRGRKTEAPERFRVCSCVCMNADHESCGL